MDVPQSFRVGMPQSFTHVFADWLTADPDKPADSGLEGTWVRVEGDPLPMPVLARIERASDGRLMVTGLILGHHERREITWNTMRSIKPATILSLIFSGFDPDAPAEQLVSARGRLYAPGVDPDDDDLVSGDDELSTADAVWLHAAAPEEYARARAAHALWQATQLPDGPPAEEVNRPRASVATDLGAFAQVYLRHYAATPNRATTATAEELHISRATAIRRLKECRDRGLIPLKETS